MFLDWTTLVLACLAAGIAWFWHDSLAAREVANRAAAEACERLALQLLDGTVSFVRLRIRRNSAGRLVLQRTYVFDYTANSIERRQGFVVVTGRHVESIGYAQETREPIRTQPPPPPEPASQATPARVIELDAWRRARSRRATPPSRDTEPRASRDEEQ
jgi:hypothetical protein